MNNRFDQAAGSWDRNERRVRMAEGIAGAMLRHLRLKPDQVLLDYGAGTGLVALKLLPYVRKIVAVDASHGMLDALGGKLAENHVPNVELLHGMIEDRSFQLPAADVIVSSMVLHHIRDTAAAAGAFWAALKPGGQIAVADLDEENGEFHGDPRAAAHNGFSRPDFRRRFEQAGFKSVRFDDACSVRKTVAGGRERDFSIFLMLAEK